MIDQLSNLEEHLEIRSERRFNMYEQLEQPMLETLDHTTE